MMIYVPLVIIAIYGINNFPEPLNKWITPIVLGVYWLILVISKVVIEKNKEKKDKDNPSSKE
jgi:hypothetical protein